MTWHMISMMPVSGDASLNTTAQEFRNMINAGLSSPPDSEGVVSVGVPSGGAMTGGLAVTQRGAGANFSVDIASGYCYVTGDDVTGQGQYFVWNDSTANVTCPAAPGTGSRSHRLIVQIQDKLSNGTWTGYQAAPVLLQDTGSGTPAQGNSAITLAVIRETAGDPSVTNASITDYRRAPGEVSCREPTDKSRSSTGLSDDGNMQLWGLAFDTHYALTGFLRYDGNSNGNSGAGTPAGGFDIGWRFPAGMSGNYVADRMSSNATNSDFTTWLLTDTPTAATYGVGAYHAVLITGEIRTGTTSPNNYLVLQWAPHWATGTATRLFTGSWLRARRLD